MHTNAERKEKGKRTNTRRTQTNHPYLILSIKSTCVVLFADVPGLFLAMPAQAHSPDHTSASCLFHPPHPPHNAVAVVLIRSGLFVRFKKSLLRHWPFSFLSCATLCVCLPFASLSLSLVGMDWGRWVSGHGKKRRVTAAHTSVLADPSLFSRIHPPTHPLTHPPALAVFCFPVLYGAALPFVNCLSVSFSSSSSS